MPRKTLTPDSQVEHLSILTEDGELDSELAPDFSDDVLLKGYRTMLMARRFDERRLELQRSGRIGTFAPVNGQEAAQVGTISALRKQDWFVPSYRETAATLWRGTPLDQLLVYDAGYNEGGAIDEDSHDLPIAIPVGTQPLHAAGIGYACRMAGSDEVAMAYFGDGATSEGDVHEALNFASVFDSPTVFVCQNNQYAISVPRSRQTHAKTIAQKALAYGMNGIQVDGNDLFACFVAAQEAVKRAREEARPTLIECVTYRLEMHTTADDPTRYREDAEVEKWRKRDPIARIEKLLRQRDALDDDARDKTEAEIKQEIDDAVTKAKARMESLDPVGPMFDHLYAEAPAELERQRKAMQDGASAGVLAHG